MGDLLTPINEIAKVKGYGISLTGDAPLGGGRAMFGVGYLEAEAADSMDRELSDNQIGRRDFDIKRYVVSVGYSYPFSKRTDVYGVASYMQDQTDTHIQTMELTNGILPPTPYTSAFVTASNLISS